MFQDLYVPNDTEEQSATNAEEKPEEQEAAEEPPPKQEVKDDGKKDAEADGSSPIAPKEDGMEGDPDKLDITPENQEDGVPIEEAEPVDENVNDG